MLLASTITSILTCLQLTGCKALSPDVSFPSVHPIAKLKAAVVLAEQHYHWNLMQSCVENQACCTMAEGNLCRTLTFLEHSLTPTWQLKQAGWEKMLKNWALQYYLACIARHPRKSVAGINEAFRGCMHMRKPFMGKSYGGKETNPQVLSEPEV